MPHNMTPDPGYKAALFWAVLVLILVVMLEGVSYLLLRSGVPARIRARVGSGSAEYHAAQLQNPRPAQPRIIKGPEDWDEKTGEPSRFVLFDPELGWDYPPNIEYEDIDGTLYRHGPSGERITCTSFGTTAISTYGDSFTYGSEVRDEDTWQTFLAKRLGTNVVNFGVGGYGTDQAYLKYDLQGRPGVRIAMLCLWPENINRVVNIYRPFYQHGDTLTLTKPRFIRDGQGFNLVPNPLRKVRDTAKLSNQSFIRQLGQLDYWYQLDQRLPSLSFPFCLSLFHWRKPVFEQLGLSAAGLLPLHSHPVYPWNLFDEPEAFSILCHVTDRFARTARSRGTDPVIVILPHKDTIREVMDYGEGRFARYLVYLKQSQYPFIDVVQAMADMHPNQTQLNAWYQGHATREGNRIIAEVIATHLARNSRLLEKARQTGSGDP
jgi:hypothetical protein